MKSMVILGSTGSIGTQALDVARLRNFTVRALTSNSNIDLLEEQIREFKPEIAAVADESRAAELRTKVADTSTRVLGGEEGICAAAQLNADKVLNSIVGIAGLKPTLAAIEAGNDDSSTSRKRYYISKDNLAWGIMVPTDFKWPLEYVNIKSAYSLFESWVTSGGTKNEEWWKTFDSSRVYK